MKNKIILAVLSVALILSVAGSAMVFADTLKNVDSIDTSVQLAEELQLSETKTSVKRASFERDDAVINRNITFEGQNISATYDRSRIDGFGNQLDTYKGDRYSRYTLDKDGNVVGFIKTYTEEETANLENIKYFASVVKVRSADEAIAIAEKYLVEEWDVDTDKYQFNRSSYTEGTYTYEVVFMAETGEFVTEDIYYVDVAVTGEVFGVTHKAEPIPSAEKLEGYTYEAVEQRAIKEISAAFGDTYKGCTISEIYAVSLDDGDYLKVSADVDYADVGSSLVQTRGYYQYYEIN